MQVRLTKKGQKALGFSPERVIANVSDNRAFVMMSNGMAIPDKGFMAVFDGEVEKPAPKIERAISEKAMIRGKAIKKTFKK